LLDSLKTLSQELVSLTDNYFAGTANHALQKSIINTFFILASKSKDTSLMTDLVYSRAISFAKEILKRSEDVNEKIGAF